MQSWAEAGPRAGDAEGTCQGMGQGPLTGPRAPPKGLSPVVVDPPQDALDKKAPEYVFAEGNPHDGEGETLQRGVEAWGA